MTQWTSQQLKCLEAIGVPIYTHVPTTQNRAPAPDPEADDKNASANIQTRKPSQAATPKTTAASEPTDTTTYYKLGPWVLELGHTIPVESYDWLRDLAAYCQSTPVQVSATDKAVSIKKYAKNQLSTAEKQDLWRLLKANL